MRTFLFLLLVHLGTNSYGHYAVKTLSCDNVEKKALLPKVEFVFRVGADGSYLDLDSVKAPGAKDILSGESWTRSELSKFSYEPDYSKMSLFISTDTGDFFADLQGEDKGTAVTVYVNTDGPRRVQFYRCPPFPFEE